MSDTNDNGRKDEGLGLDDPDRLPWLETADGYEYDEGASPLKIAGMVLAGLVLLGAIVGGIFWLQRDNGMDSQGKGELIVAQEGPYKTRPDVAGGKTFEGEGDAAFAASEGKRTGATIAPVAAKEDDAKAKAAPAPAAVKPEVASATPAGAVMVQLGAFNNSAQADTAWTAFGKRFGFLSGVNRRVVEATVEGRKVVRLQAITPNAAAAQQLCAKLKAAGENCLIVR